MRIGIFLPNWIGDTVMATPALRAIRSHFGPDSQLLGVMRPYLADVLAGTSWLDESLFFDPRSRDAKLNAWHVVRELRRRRLDLVVLLSNSLRTGLMAWACRAQRTVGYARYARGWLLDTAVRPPRQRGKLVPTPTIDAYLKLAYAAGCPAESSRLELATTAADEAAADAVWKKLALPDGEHVVVLNSGGAYGAAKHWPAEHFGLLARRVADQGLSVLVNCGPSERALAAEIVRHADHRSVVSLANEDRLPIGLAKACIRRSRLLVSTDSGPRFFAVAFGVPVVALFGPTDPVLSRTGADHEIELAHAIDCHPCMRRTCPLGHHRCMRDLTVDTVYRAVERQLERARPEMAGRGRAVA